jgi:hypothetical protein
MLTVLKTIIGLITIMVIWFLIPEYIFGFTTPIGIVFVVCYWVALAGIFNRGNKTV